MFCVYLLQSFRDHSYYIWQTENISARLIRHNCGEVISTRNKRPWRLIGFEEYDTRKEAMQREYILKHSTKKKKEFIDKFCSRSSIG